MIEFTTTGTVGIIFFIKLKKQMSTNVYKKLISTTTETLITSRSRVYMSHPHNFWGFISSQGILTDFVTQFDVEMILSTVVHNSNFNISSVVYIDNTCSYIRVFDGKTRSRSNPRINSRRSNQSYVSRYYITFQRFYSFRNR